MQVVVAVFDGSTDTVPVTWTQRTGRYAFTNSVVVTDGGGAAVADILNPTDSGADVFAPGLVGEVTVVVYDVP